MKKFLTLIGAALIGLSASAANYYLVGFKSWDNPSSYVFTDAGNGEYTLDLNETLTGEFKITNGTWDATGTYGGNGALTIGQTYNLTMPGDNITINGGAVENPHFVFNPTAKTLVITGQETVVPSTYAIHGSIFTGNSESWVNKDMTEKDGKWVLSDVTVFAGNFGIMVKQNGTQSGWYSAPNGSATVVLNQNLTCAASNNTDFTLASAGTYTFTFDPEALTLYVTGEAGEEPETPETPETDYSSWYVNFNGDFTDWQDNGVLANKEGIATMDGLAIGTGEFEIKIWNGSAIYYGTGGVIAVGEWVQLTNGGGHMTVAGATDDSVYDAEYNCATNQIKLTLISGEPNYNNYWINITGEFNGWADEQDGVQPDEEGVSISKNVAIGTSPFQVRVWNGNSAKYYTCENALVQKEWTQLYAYDDHENYGRTMSIQGATADQKFYVSFNLKTNQVYVEDATEAGVEGVAVEAAPVEYFNLQGVRVANPENGLYIRRQGNTATKVLVK